MPITRVHARPLRRLLPSGLRTVRLASGLVLFTYITLHFINHSLGNVSLAWMERGLVVHKFIWQGMIGTAALYCALTMHFALGLWALYERRRLYWTPPELTQLLLGLAIPPLLAIHLEGTRIAFATFDLDKGYTQELYNFWVATPYRGYLQLALLIIAWSHGCFGCYFWLRLKPWFPRAQSVLLAAAVLLPVLALLGYFQAGRAVVALAQDPAWRGKTMSPSVVGTAAQNQLLDGLRNGFLLADGLALTTILLGRLTRVIAERRRGRIRIDYPDGRRALVPIGFSVLEASRFAGIPHAGPCGGRGRCSVCRVRVLGRPELPAPQTAEKRVLEQLGFDVAAVRLACQLRPSADLTVVPLVSPAVQTAFLHRRQRRSVAEERFLVHLFVDMRDSTRLAATRLPHDSLFVLGRFVAAVSAAVVKAGGTPNQFLGDGILAIFGLDADPRTACAQAVAALGLVARNLRELAALLEGELDGALAFGAGMQCGRTIMGEIGFRDHVTFTGLGDPPNVASRLQSLAKELGCEAVVAEDVLRTAGLSGAGLPAYIARLRGRDEPVRVRLFFALERDVGRLVPVDG